LILKQKRAEQIVQNLILSEKPELVHRGIEIVKNMAMVKMCPTILLEWLVQTIYHP
jgi:hypothetical protein